MIKKNSKWFWTIVAILYTGFIFHNSMTPAVESSRQSGRVLTMVLSVVGNLGIEGTWITEYVIRKMAHFGEYALLGILLSVTLEQYTLRLREKRGLQICLGQIIPFADETIQLFVEGRSGQISDVWLDMAGILAGSLAAGVVLWLKRGRGN